MTAVQLAQIVGIVSIYALFSIKIFIVIFKDHFSKETLVAGTLWTAMYFYFLGFLRLVNLLDFASVDAIRIISGWSSVIPLGAVLIHLYMLKGKQLTIEDVKKDQHIEAERKEKLKS